MPKKRGPFQLVPVMARAMLDRLVIGLAVPEEAVIHHGHVVGRSPPFAHQHGARPRQRACSSVGRIGCFIAKHASQQPVELLGHRSGEPAVAPFLPRIGDAKRQNVTSERPWCLACNLPLPEYAQLSTRLLLQVVDVDIPIAIDEALSPRLRRRASPLTRSSAERRDRLAVGRSVRQPVRRLYGGPCSCARNS